MISRLRNENLLWAIERAGQVGAAAGATLAGVAIGDTVGAVTAGAGTLAGALVGDMVRHHRRRNLDELSELRLALGATAIMAQMGQRLAEGSALRDDGFFDPENVEPRELVDALLTKVEREPQLHKAPHVSHIFTWVAFSQVSADTGQMMLGWAERLTWRQCLLLAACVRHSDTGGVIGIHPGMTRHQRDPLFELMELRSMTSLGLMRQVKEAIAPDGSNPEDPGWQNPAWTIDDEGGFLVAAMGLHLIPEDQVTDAWGAWMIPSSAAVRRDDLRPDGQQENHDPDDQ